MPPKLDETALSTPTATVPANLEIPKESVATQNADPAKSSSPTNPGEASLLARYSCASLTLAIFAVWGKFTFMVDGVPGGTTPLHSWKVPAALNLFYLVSLPLLRWWTDSYLSKAVDVKSLLKESMLIYNVGQVLLNGWMVWVFVKLVVTGAHPFIGGQPDLVETGATFVVWTHYCDKYLEYLDTYFMVLRGRMDQVSFLHVYHHTSISFAWWIGLSCYPGGDIYFGALFNSFIHVLMYSYYAMALLKISCPWKKYLTQAQLLQFTTVVLYTVCVMVNTPAEQRNTQVLIGGLVQAFEMTSLFVLFMAFYRKAYTKKSKSKSGEVALPKREDASSVDAVSLSSDESTEGQQASVKKNN